jgi:hypothetical protein
MTRGPGHGRHGSRGCSQLDTEAEAAAAATALAGLRSRLRCQDTLEHPAVQLELRKFDEQVTVQLSGQTSRRPGKHRSPGGETTGRGGQQISDAADDDLKPDPLSATTPAEYIRLLWQYKVWSGDPSWRKMAARAGQTVVHSTMHSAMNGDALPRLEVVKAIITGCGGSEDDLRAFVSAWRRIEVARTRDAFADPDFLAAPVPDLDLVPAG